VREVTIDDVKPRLDRHDAFHLVDVREESEFAAGHLPGAAHLGKGIIERDVEAAIPDPTAEIVLYCGGGFRSALAADNLQKMGYQNVWSMDGGIRAWREAGYPTA
jgi:rhodanese-related sulfurtransferase